MDPSNPFNNQQNSTYYHVPNYDYQIPQPTSLQNSNNFEQVDKFKEEQGKIEIIQRQESFQSLSRQSFQKLDPSENKEQQENKKRLRKKKNYFFEDGYDDNFVGDEDDRQFLDSLNHLEREKVIQDRYQNRQKLIQQQKMEAQFNSQLHNFEQDFLTNQPFNKQNLNNLRDDTMNFLDKKEEEYIYEPQNKERKNIKKIKDELKINPTEDLPLLNKILMRREILFQYHNKLHFEKMAQNCLIKIHYGNTMLKNNYKIGIITGVKWKKERYTFEGKSYNVYLDITVGQNQQWEIQMQNASNKEIHESQAYKLLDELQGVCDFTLDMNWVNKKIQELDLYMNYKITNKDIIKINENRIKQQTQLETFEDYIQRKRLFEERVEILEQLNFEEFDQANKDEIEELKRKIEELNQIMQTNPNFREKFLKMYHKQSGNYLEFNQLSKEERVVFERKQANPLNMWTIEYNQIEKIEMQDQERRNSWEEQGNEENRYFYEENLKNFLEIYKRDLEIDSLIDNLQVIIQLQQYYQCLFLTYFQIQVISSPLVFLKQNFNSSIELLYSKGCA